MCENDYNSFPQSIHIKNTWFFAELSSLSRNHLTRTNGYPVQKASVCYTQAPSYTKQKPILINYFCTRNYCNHFLWLFYLSLKRYIRTKGRTCLRYVVPSFHVCCDSLTLFICCIKEFLLYFSHKADNQTMAKVDLMKWSKSYHNSHNASRMDSFFYYIYALEQHWWLLLSKLIRRLKGSGRSN